MKKGIIAGLCLLLVVAALIYRCKRDAGESLSKCLEISFSLELTTIDPGFAHNYPGVIAVKMIYEGLMRRGFNDQLIPAVAESYEVSSDQKVYTFHLRPSLWSNGEKVTAYDFEYAWKRIIDPSFPTTGTLNFYPIKNVEAIVKKELPIESVGIHAADENTLVVELEHPAPYFLETTTCASYSPVNCKNPTLTNGPFAVKEWRQGVKLALVKNVNYWDAEHVYLPGIDVHMINDPMTNLMLYKQKQLDWIGRPLSRIPFEAIPTMEKEKKLEHIFGVGVQWYFLNTKMFPFTNKKIRQAFAYAINRKEMSEHLFVEGEMPALSILPGSLSVKSSPYFPDGDIKKAKMLFEEGLKELGISNRDMPEIILHCPSEPMHETVAQVVQRQWNQTFGVTIQIVAQDWKTLNDKINSGKFQIGGMGWIPSIRDPIYMLKTFKYSTDSINKSRWENSRYRHLLDASDDELNPEKRKQIFVEAESLLMDEMPVIPVNFINVAYAKNPQLHNVCMSEFGDVDFTWAYFENKK